MLMPKKTIIKINSETNNDNDLAVETISSTSNSADGDMAEMKKCFRSSNEILKSLVMLPPHHTASLSSVLEINSNSY